MSTMSPSSQSVDSFTYPPVASILPAPSSAIAGPLEALQQHFDLQLAQLGLVEQSLKTHFNNVGLGGSSNPVSLLARLKAIQEQLPLLQERAKRLAVEREQVERDANALVQANQQFLSTMAARVDAATASGLSPLVIPSNNYDSPVKLSSLVTALKSRPSTAPLNPSTPVVQRRKSLRPSAPPSPSTIIEAQLLEQIHASNELEGPISEAEFAAVSTTVKSRVKLADVNHMLSIIQTHFSRYVAQHKVKDAASLPPLTLNTLAEEGGVKIGGASSQCIIGTLRACKRIIVGKTGISLVKPPIGK